MIYDCCDDRRRNAIAEHPLLNGIDYLEVLDGDAPEDSPRQRTLMLKLLKPVPASLGRENTTIIGGERIKDINVEWAAAANNLDPLLATQVEIDWFGELDQPDHFLIIRTRSAGDFSQYRLRLQNGELDASTPPNFDPRLIEVTFSFKVECRGDFDCESVDSCENPAEVPVDSNHISSDSLSSNSLSSDILSSDSPSSNYLNRDYASFRQLILDRMATLAPGWQRRNAADLGVTLAELMAYVGDQFSYWQDAVSTEAYLGTARRRTSLRRHAKLVDYKISEGRNARAWVHLNVSVNELLLQKNASHFLTRVENVESLIAPDTKQQTSAMQQRPQIFEPMHDVTLFSDHNEMLFYTWGNSRCCLGAGAISASLVGHLNNLAVGDVLLIEEVRGAHTGNEEDADPEKRCVVRLTQVVVTNDPIDDSPITQIFWQQSDALPFAITVSSETDPEHGQATLDNVSVVRGNLVLVDHGETIVNEDLDQVPPPLSMYTQEKSGSRCESTATLPVPPRYRPLLKQGPLVFSASLPDTSSKASSASFLLPALNEVDAAIVQLQSSDGNNNQEWDIQSDLFNSAADDFHFVVETENNGDAYLRFGDDINGNRPNSGTTFNITYRVGGGVNGNVGSGAIAHIVTNESGIAAVRNPLPAIGGLAAETPEQIRRRAPQAFRTQQRAVTPEDYADVTQQYPGIQQAAGGLRWTGSWYTASLTVDRMNGVELDTAFNRELIDHVEPFRMAGQDLAFNDPVFVSLEMELEVCVLPKAFRSDVKAQLLSVFNSEFQDDGRPGLFHPDNFSFGQTVFLSPFYAAARQVPGVSSVKITGFHRQGDKDPKPLADGHMKLGRLEIPRLDNKPNFPEHGVLRLRLRGGK